MENFGPRLRALRESRDLTQLELARRAGLTQGMIAKLETTAQANPTINTLLALSAALDVPVTTLVTQDEAAKVA